MINLNHGLWSCNSITLSVVTRIFQEKQVNVMTANTLASCVTRPSTAMAMTMKDKCHQTSNISYTLIGNIVGYSDVVGALPVGAAPTTSSFLTEHLVPRDWAETTARRDENHLSFDIWCDFYSKSSFSSRDDFNCLCHLNVEKWWKMQIYSDIFFRKYQH